MTTFEWISTVFYVVGSAIALVTVVVGLSQVKELIKQVKAAVEANTINRLNTLLSLEDSIADRRLKLAETGIRVTELGKKNLVDKGTFESAQLEYDEAKQLYLNGLDRLCYCILKKLLSEDELRSEYRNYINDTVKMFPNDFGTTTGYRNVKKLYEKWADT